MYTHCTCELCAFQNPKPTTAAIVIRDGKLLLLKRNIDPFRGEWDFVGGYVDQRETPEECVRREMKEELGVDSSVTYINCFTGSGFYKKYEYPVLAFAYLAEIQGNIVLNEENSEYAWIPLNEISDIAFDSNKKILAYVKAHFNFDFERVKELTRQLDPSAQLNEQSLYKAVINGFISTAYDGKKLIGMGWIFPRQTMLRRQAIVEDMIVDEAYRGKGLGRKILTELVDWAKKYGVDVIELTSNPKRIAANELYKKFGFKLHETNHYLYFVT